VFSAPFRPAFYTTFPRLITIVAYLVFMLDLRQHDHPSR
jgi:hypothetical protein